MHTLLYKKNNLHILWLCFFSQTFTFWLYGSTYSIAGMLYLNSVVTLTL